MGSGESKEKDEEESVLPCHLIGYDEHGNLSLLVGGEKRDRDDEMVRIMNFDKIEGEDEKPWSIMDSVWVQSWLCYVHLERNIAPMPGPCRNDRLIMLNQETNEWVARSGLIMAVKDRAGDYRRVTEEVWREFQKLYPGSGPEISTFFVVDEETEDPHKLDGYYDTSSWKIVLDAKKEVQRELEPKRFLSLDNLPFRSKKDSAAGGESSSSSLSKTTPSNLKMEAMKSTPQESFLGRRASNQLRSPPLTAPSSSSSEADGAPLVATSPPQEGIALTQVRQRTSLPKAVERRSERFYNEVFFDDESDSVPIGEGQTSAEN